MKDHYRQIETVAREPVREITSTAIGDQVRTRRDDLGLSQMQAAEQIGISHRQFSKIERGRVPSPRAKTRRQIDTWLAA